MLSGKMRVQLVLGEITRNMMTKVDPWHALRIHIIYRITNCDGKIIVFFRFDVSFYVLGNEERTWLQ